MKVYHGDEWKQEGAGKCAPNSRAAQQTALNADYATGKIGVEEWSRRFDEISVLQADGTPMTKGAK